MLLIFLGFKKRNYLKVRSLRDTRSRLEGKLEQLQSQLSRRPDIDTFTYNNQVCDQC